MVTSTPAPTDAGEPNGSLPRYETLTTVAEQVAAIDTLIPLAKHSIRVFDIDLSRMGWNDPARSQKLSTFLRTATASRLEIIVHDTGWIERSCPRLMNLFRLHSHAVSIRRTGQDAKSAMDPLMIVDGIHFLHRFDIAQPRAALSIGDSEAALPFVTRFDAISESSEPGLTASVLGL
jgi:hypothetical protein